MSDESSDRGWIAVLAVMVLVTAACAVGYFLAPFDAPLAEAADTGTNGLVAARDRIVAVTEDGALVVLDRRDGSLSETVLASGVPADTAIDVGEKHEAAYVVGSGTDPVIRSVSVRTGKRKDLASGRLVSIGPIAFPTLARDIQRPAAEHMAWVTGHDGVDAIDVQNLVTGSTETIGARSQDPPFRSVDDLVWSPFENRLFGIADGGHQLFRLDADRATTLEEAVVADVPDGIDHWIDATPWGDGLAVIGQTSSGATKVVEIDRKTLAVVGTLYAPTDASALRTVDADSSATELLITTDAGTLLELTDTHEVPTTLAQRIARAVW